MKSDQLQVTQALRLTSLAQTSFRLASQSPKALCPILKLTQEGNGYNR